MADSNADEALYSISARIPDMENAGATPESRAFFEQLLGPGFGFRRRTGEIIGREAFLGALKSGGDRVLADGPHVTPMGTERALVRFTVSATADGALARFDNLQLYARDQSGDWKLIGWANEQD
jgi:hypothetical protein